MKKIKWENIFIILILPIFTYGIILHIIGGISVDNLILEIVIYYSIAFLIRGAIKTIRKGE